jgi:hypothetical protein
MSKRERISEFKNNIIQLGNLLIRDHGIVLPDSPISYHLRTPIVKNKYYVACDKDHNNNDILRIVGPGSNLICSISDTIINRNGKEITSCWGLKRIHLTLNKIADGLYEPY